MESRFNYTSASMYIKTWTDCCGALTSEGGVLGPQLGTDAWTKDRRKVSKQCVPSLCGNNRFCSVVRETYTFHLLILTTLNIECLFHYDLKNLPFSTKCIFSYPKRWQRCTAQLWKSTLSHRFFCSSISTKLGSKRPTRDWNNLSTANSSMRGYQNAIKNRCQNIAIRFKIKRCINIIAQRGPTEEYNIEKKPSHWNSKWSNQLRGIASPTP